MTKLSAVICSAAPLASPTSIVCGSTNRACAGVDRHVVPLVEAAAHVFLLADDRFGRLAELRESSSSTDDARLAKERGCC